MRLQLQLHYLTQTTLDYTAVRYTTLRYTTLQLQPQLQLQLHDINYTTTTTPLHYSYNYSCATPHNIQQLWVRWPLQPLQTFQKKQLQPPFGPSVDSLHHPGFTTTNLSNRLPVFETSATALRGTTGIYYYIISNYYMIWYVFTCFASKSRSQVPSSRSGKMKMRPLPRLRTVHGEGCLFAVP